MNNYNKDERFIVVSFMILLGFSLLTTLLFLIQEVPSGENAMSVAIGISFLIGITVLLGVLLSFILSVATLFKYKMITKRWIKLLGLMPIIIASLYISMLFINGSISW